MTPLRFSGTGVSCSTFDVPFPISPSPLKPQAYTVWLGPAIARVSSPLVETWVTPASGTVTGAVTRTSGPLPRKPAPQASRVPSERSA
jgi:hypothetical protein